MKNKAIRKAPLALSLIFALLLGMFPASVNASMPETGGIPAAVELEYEGLPTPEDKAGQEPEGGEIPATGTDTDSIPPVPGSDSIIEEETTAGAADDTQATAGEEEADQTETSEENKASGTSAGLDGLDGLMPFANPPASYNSEYIRWLIGESTDGSITLPANFVLDEPIDIAAPLTIHGGGYVLDATHGGRHFTVSTAGNVTFNSLSLTATDGGGVEAATTAALELNFNDVNISGLQNTGVNGGAVSGAGNAALVMHFTNTTLNGNSAMHGGAVYNELGSVILDNFSNTLDNNSALADGGALYAAFLITSGGEINGNTAGGNGGAVYLANSLGWDSREQAVQLYGTEMSGNTATNGGAFYLSSQGLAGIDFCTVTGNTATANGGGLYALTTNGNLTLSGSTFDSNRAVLGGGIYAEPDIEFTNTTLSNNTASHQGGGLYTTNQASIKSGSVIAGNTAAYQGGGVYNAGTQEGDMTDTSGATYYGNKALSDTGGAIFMQHFSRVYTMQCEFYDNYAYITAYWQHLLPPEAYDHHPSNALNSDILYTSNTSPFPNIFNGADISFDSEDTDNGQATVYEVKLVTGDGYWADGGVGDRTIRVPEDYPVVLPFAVTKYGRAPSGWYRDAGYTQEWTFDTPVREDGIILYARWPSYTVRFELDGIQYGSPETVALGGTATQPSLAKPGYTLDGWYYVDTDSGNTLLWDFTAPVDQDLTLTAGWQFDGFTVTYWLNGKVYTTEHITTENGLATAPGVNDLEGYQLNAWYDDQGEMTAINGRKYDFGLPVTQDLDLYGEWEFDGYDLSYFLSVNGGSYPAVPNYTGHLFTNTGTAWEPTLPDGYAFVAGEEGWFYDEARTIPWDFATIVKEDLELYANIEFAGYTVTLYIDGEEYDILEKVPEGTIARPDIDAEAEFGDGYVLDGWYTTPTLAPSSEWKFATQEVDSNLSLYAALTFTGYDVQFYINDMPYGEGFTLPDKNQTITAPAPSRDGYTLDGWYYIDDADGQQHKWEFSNEVNQDLDLHAYWRFTGYTVRFILDGEVVHTAQVPMGQAVAQFTDIIPAPAPDYWFDGWYTTTQHTDKWIFATPVPCSMDLYANWVEGYTVEFFIDGEAAGEYITTSNGETLSVPDIEARDGYTLNGWYTGPSLRSKYAFGAEITSDLKLYAVWEFTGYTVTYWYQGEIWRQETGVEENAQLTAPQEPLWEGYDFIGWFTDPQRQNEWNFADGRVTASMDLYGKWDFEGYYVLYFIEDSLYYFEPELLEAGEKTTPPQDPEIDGYRFDGWFYDEACTIPWKFADGVYEDLELYGLLTEVGYDIRYYVDGSLYYEEEALVRNGDLLVPPAGPPAKPGYIFAGWRINQDSEDIWDFAVDTVHSSLSFHAWYLYIGYDVYFLVDGAVHQKQTGLDAGILLLAPELAAREGYTFQGWYRGSMDDLPQDLEDLATAPLIGRTMPLAAPTAEEIVLVYWDFDLDGMPEETLVLIAGYAEDTGGGGTGGEGSGSDGLRKTSYRGRVRTGDESRIPLFLSSAALAAIALLGLALIKRRRRAG